MCFVEIYAVHLSEKAKRNLLKVPVYITKKLMYWVDAVSNEGLSVVRKVSGYHDEPLQGNRKGQRSIRLNRSYRAIYEIDTEGVVHFIEVVEVNKHEY